MPTNQDTLKLFIQYFNAKDTANIMNQFCKNDPNAGLPNPNPPPNIIYNAPVVGLTDHGPAFYGEADVLVLFQRLFSTFKDLTWVPYMIPGYGAAPKLTWAAPPDPPIGKIVGEIGVQFNFTGTYKGNWFPVGDDHWSPPLSNLQNYAHFGESLGKKRGNKDGLPAFAVFSFDGAATPKIRQLQMYLDRYALMQSITKYPKEWEPD
jgi:hypothetical protein